MLASGMPEVHAFLRDYPLMALRPSAGKHLVLKGRFSFSARAANGDEVFESFTLTILVPKNFPKEMPVAMETGGRIPREADFHVNTSDGTLCLGSPLRLLVALSKSPTLVGFAETLLVPYLFAISRKLQTGGNMVFGELAHGSVGALTDYAEMLGLKDSTQVFDVLTLLGMKKRLANKRACPCGCNLRLGKCGFNRRVAQFRRLASRSWFRKHYTGAYPATRKKAGSFPDSRIPDQMRNPPGLPRLFAHRATAFLKSFLA